jgi:HEXXH motif-containing protein
MNLALESLERFSDLGFDGLARDRGPGMPRHFLLSTGQLQPALRSRRVEIEALADALADDTDAWRNPEVYAQIALLAQAAAGGLDPDPPLELLRVHAGLVAPSTIARSDGPVRLTEVDGSIRMFADDAITLVQDEVVASVPDLDAKVLLPYPGLYSDLVEPRLYPDARASRAHAELLGDVGCAVELLGRHAPDVLADLREVIRLVVLTPDLRDERQWSYNLRLAYFGAIFVNAHEVGRYGVAEALLHEYFHQRLWQWWTYEPPEGLPPDGVTIRSPVTDREKPATVMLQALLIYVAAHHFYGECWSAGVGEGSSPWVERRLASLERAIPQLHTSLRDVVAPKSRAALILEHAAESFTPGLIPAL